mmetsp:Transcript_9022/g.26974  ORF Transcript_9022/g.26974 Transcript_9022/m.26974 type:complete len:355 (-) Transcript_9022:226-1290(-)
MPLKNKSNSSSPARPPVRLHCRAAVANCWSIRLLPGPNTTHAALSDEWHVASARPNEETCCCSSVFFRRDASRSRVPEQLLAPIEVAVQSQQIPLEHRNGHLAYLRDKADAWPRGEQCNLVDILVTCNIDHNGPLPHPGRVHLVAFGGNAEHHHIGLASEAFGRRSFGNRFDCPSQKFVRRVNVDAVNHRPIIGEHRCQWPANNLGPVHDGHGLSSHPIADRALVVVRAEVLQDLDDRQGRARQHAFPGLVGINEALVLVQGPAVKMAQALNILTQGDRIAQVVVVRAAIEARSASENGIIYHHSMHRWVPAGVLKRLLQLLGVHLSQLKVHAVPPESLASPLRILSRGWVVVG